jgi:AsmA protein
VVTAKLAIDKLDLDTYLPSASAPTAQPVAAPGPHPAPSPATQGGQRNALTGASPLELADVDFDLEIGSIAYERFQIGASTLGLHVRDGRISADLRRLALYQGSGHGRVTVDPTSSVPSIGLDLALMGVAIEPLAQAMVDSNRFSGTGNFDIAVSARGRSEQDLVRSLYGSGRLSLANGRIDGVDLLKLAKSAAKIWRDLIGTLDVAGAPTARSRGSIR